MIKAEEIGMEALQKKDEGSSAMKRKNQCGFQVEGSFEWPEK